MSVKNGNLLRGSRGDEGKRADPAHLYHENKENIPGPSPPRDPLASIFELLDHSGPAAAANSGRSATAAVARVRNASQSKCPRQSSTTALCSVSLLTTISRGTHGNDVATHGNSATSART